MPAERLSMRQIREVLRLCFESRLPQRAVARSLGLSQRLVGLPRSWRTGRQGIGIDDRGHAVGIEMAFGGPEG